MEFEKNEESDLLELAALLRLIIAAIRAFIEKRPQDLQAFLCQISAQYNAASSHVRSEVAEPLQELKNLVGEFGTSVSNGHTSTGSKPKQRVAAYALIGFAAVLTLGAFGVKAISQTGRIPVASSMPSSQSSPTVTSERSCPWVNPARVKVKDYYRDGKLIKSHERTAPNDTKSDNLETCR